MRTAEARRALKKAGFYIARVMPGINLEVWTNGRAEIRLGQSPTLGSPEAAKIRTMLRDAIPEKKTVFSPRQATMHTRVRALIDFQEVPNGTTGTIDEVYATGFMVKWDLPQSLRDGFDAKTEMQFLERIG